MTDEVKQKVASLLLWYRLQGVSTAHVSEVPQKNSTNDALLGCTASVREKQLRDRLFELHQDVLNFTGCNLIHSCLNTVFSDGNPNAPIMVVGEAPGMEEDRLGKPFVGPSGQLLDAILRVFGWDRTCCYITNIVPWRPPFNRQPSVSEIEACLPFVDRHIHIIAPKILLCVGSVACKSLLRTQSSISELQRKQLVYHNPLERNPGSNPIPTFAFYHPAYLLRSPGQKRVVWKHMLRMKAFLLEYAGELCAHIV